MLMLAKKEIVISCPLRFVAVLLVYEMRFQPQLDFEIHIYRFKNTVFLHHQTKIISNSAPLVIDLPYYYYIFPYKKALFQSFTFTEVKKKRNATR